MLSRIFYRDMILEINYGSTDDIVINSFCNQKYVNPAERKSNFVKINANNKVSASENFNQAA